MLFPAVCQRFFSFLRFFKLKARVDVCLKSMRIIVLAGQLFNFEVFKVEYGAVEKFADCDPEGANYQRHRFKIRSLCLGVQNIVHGAGVNARFLRYFILSYPLFFHYFFDSYRERFV